MKLREMLRRLKLASQFTILLSLIFIVGIGLGGFALSKALEHRAENEISDRAQLVMHLMNSVSNYTNEQVTPLLRTELDSQTRLIPESIPSVASHQVFSRLQENWKYKDYLYKTAALNPTNPADKSDLFEAKLIERFQSDRTLKTLSGFRNQLFYSAQPLAIHQESCLKCHGIPEQAPKSHRDRYGSENGYGWNLNEIIGTRIVYLPAYEVFSHARQALFVFITIFTVIFASVLLLVNYLLRRRVIRPLKPMANLAEQLCLERVDAVEVEILERKGLNKIAQRGDELGQLGKIFQRMVQEVRDREQKLAEQLRQLRVEIDHNQRIQQVSEIEETDYFQELQRSAKQIRDQWTEPKNN
jgi:HAMP domain-containing protein